MDMEQSNTMVSVATLFAKRFLSEFDYLHSLHVMSKVEGNRRKILAVLHDVIEGSDDRTSILEMLSVFGSDVVDDLLLLTREEGNRYRKYIQILAESERIDAITVKLADLEHNMDLTRLDIVEQYHRDRKTKYQKAFRTLSQALHIILYRIENAH
jgi:(p)ppGpp synthase/HD superfamily hydrolase